MNNFFGNLSVMPFLKRGDRRGVIVVGLLDIGCFDISCIAERRVFFAADDDAGDRCGDSGDGCTGGRRNVSTLFAGLLAQARALFISAIKSDVSFYLYLYVIGRKNLVLPVCILFNDLVPMDKKMLEAQRQNSVQIILKALYLLQNRFEPLNIFFFFVYKGAIIATRSPAKITNFYFICFVDNNIS